MEFGVRYVSYTVNGKRFARHLVQIHHHLRHDANSRPDQDLEFTEDRPEEAESRSVGDHHSAIFLRRASDREALLKLQPSGETSLRHLRIWLRCLAVELLANDMYPLWRRSHHAKPTDSTRTSRHSRLGRPHSV